MKHKRRHNIALGYNNSHPKFNRAYLLLLCACLLCPNLHAAEKEMAHPKSVIIEVNSPSAAVTRNAAVISPVSNANDPFITSDIPSGLTLMLDKNYPQTSAEEGSGPSCPFSCSIRKCLEKLFGPFFLFKNAKQKSSAVLSPYHRQKINLRNHGGEQSEGGPSESKAQQNTYQSEYTGCYKRWVPSPSFRPLIDKGPSAYQSSPSTPSFLNRLRSPYGFLSVPFSPMLGPVSSSMASGVSSPHYPASYRHARSCGRTFNFNMSQNAGDELSTHQNKKQSHKEEKENTIRKNIISILAQDPIKQEEYLPDDENEMDRKSAKKNKYKKISLASSIISAQYGPPSSAVVVLNLIRDYSPLHHDDRGDKDQAHAMSQDSPFSSIKTEISREIGPESPQSVNQNEIQAQDLEGDQVSCKSEIQSEMGSENRNSPKGFPPQGGEHPSPEDDYEMV